MLCSLSSVPGKPMDEPDAAMPTPEHQKMVQGIGTRLEKLDSDHHATMKQIYIHSSDYSHHACESW
jgi:hypothetical protein